MLVETALKGTVAEPVIRRVAMRAGCGDIEEVNVYDDSFESGIHAAGTFGLYLGIQVIGDGINEFGESEGELKIDIVDNGDGTASVDPDWLDAAENDFSTWLAMNWWWIFIDPGYGSSDEYYLDCVWDVTAPKPISLPRPRNGPVL